MSHFQKVFGVKKCFKNRSRDFKPVVIIVVCELFADTLMHDFGKPVIQRSGRQQGLKKFHNPLRLTL